jgi:hypothetical protein
MPSFRYLNTYVLIPSQMTVASSVIYPGTKKKSAQIHRIWEIKQTLPDQDTYQSICETPRLKSHENMEQVNCLAIRDRHLELFNSLLERHSLVSIGMYPPQSIWKDLCDKLCFWTYEGIILLKTKLNYLIVYFQRDGFPILKYRNHNTPTEGTAVGLNRLEEDLYVYSTASNFTERLPVFILRENFNDNEREYLEDNLKLNFNSIDADLLPSDLSNGIQSEYLPLLLAHERIERQYT